MKILRASFVGMKLDYRLLGLAALGSLLPVVNLAFAQTWTQTSAPITNWTSVASSADGTKLVAVVGGVPGGSIHTSTNSGATWTPSSAPVTNWTAVASSADGSKLVAATGSGPIYVSSDSGANWTPTTASNAVAVASSADGIHLIAASQGQILMSPDLGGTWLPSGVPFGGWLSVASSAEGTTLAVAGAGPFADIPIYVSTNSGATWTNTDTYATRWSSIASSADGRRMAAASVRSLYGNSPGLISTSTNSGVTWNVTSAPGTAWSFVASSADGSHLVAVGGGVIFTSVDAGGNWSSNNAPVTNWSSVASSADGSKLIALINGGGIWISQSTPTPELHITPSGSDLVLSWIVPATAFVLQENADITTTDWTDVTNTPTLNLASLRNEMVIASTNGSRFYRLKH
ncbi:MAG: hypothetical protein HY298_11740 [Verrucomicrobia bacterium]|nr:hypothetical protein [Verrucomicrobiota bacterium]